MAIQTTDRNIQSFKEKASHLQYSLASTISRINKKLLKNSEVEKIKQVKEISEKLDQKIESLKPDLDSLKTLALFAETIS